MCLFSEPKFLWFVWNPPLLDALQWICDEPQSETQAQRIQILTKQFYNLENFYYFQMNNDSSVEM